MSIIGVRSQHVRSLSRSRCYEGVKFHIAFVCAKASRNAEDSVGGSRWFSQNQRSQQNVSNARRVRECIANIKRLGSQQSWQQAVHIFAIEQKRGTGLDASCYVALASSCEKASRWEFALALATHSLQQQASCEMRISASAYSTAIAAYGRGLHWARALQLFAQAKDKYAQDTVLWNSVMGACARAHRWRHALSLFTGVRISGLYPTPVTYGTVISACEKGQEWSRACSLLHDMSHVQIKPSVVCYNAGMSAYGKGHLWEASIGLLSVMSKHELKPSVVSFNTCISACVNANVWRHGLRLFGDMPYHKVDRTLITFNASIAACDRGGLWDFAFALLDEMRTVAIRPDAVGYNAAISSCRTSSRWECAISALSNMLQVGPKPDIISFNAAIDVCKHKSLWSWALHLLGVVRGEADLETFNTVASACVAGGEFERALSLLDECLLAGLQPSTVSCNTYISACERSHRWASAMDLFAEAKRRGIANVIGLNLTISACEKSFRWSEALRLLQQPSSILSYEPDIVSFNCALSACERASQWRHVVALFSGSGRLEKDTLGSSMIGSCLSGQAFRPNAVSYKVVLRASCHGPISSGMAVYREAVEAGYEQVSHERIEMNTVDLHGLSVEGARFATLVALLDSLLSGDTEELTFITGRGVHSDSQTCVVRDELFCLLQDDLDLHAMQVPGNAGRVVVSLTPLRTPEFNNV